MTKLNNICRPGCRDLRVPHTNNIWSRTKQLSIITTAISIMLLVVLMIRFFNFEQTNCKLDELDG